MPHIPGRNNVPTCQTQAAPQQPSAATSTPGREANGRFARGNPGGPGNPFARRTAAARKAFCDAVSHEDLVEIARAMKAKAKGGDVAAAKLVLAYAVGKPADVVEPDTLDLEEFKQYEEEVRHTKSLPAVAATPGLGLACSIARTSRPGIADTAAKDLGQALIEGEFREDSPFALPDDFECQEVPGSDTPPSTIGSICAPVQGHEELPSRMEARPQPLAAGGELPGQMEGEATSGGQEVFIPLAELAQLLPPETEVRVTLGSDTQAARMEVAADGLGQVATRPPPSANRGNGGHPGAGRRGGGTMR
jgi:hypothetical protein